jgi:diguanylate cyclase (GGDEF)-like protein
MMPDEIGLKKGFKDDILMEQVRLAVKQIPTMQIASFIVALVLSYTVRDIVPHTRILIWVLMVLATVVSRIVLSYQFFKVSEHPFDAEYWKNAYLLLALVSGVVWGLSAFLIFPAGKPALISLFVLVITTLSASTTISHSSILIGPAVWAGPAILLYAVRCAWEGGETENTIAFLIIVYLVTIIQYSFNHHRTITSAISLKFENLELLEEVRKTNEILRRVSAVDGLTGLANRYSFEEFMEREWRRAIRDQRPLSLIMADIDHFKAYNDTYGHQGGDDCLKKVARVIAQAVKRPADLAARYGGEEFMAVLPDTDLNGALDIAETLRRGVEALGIPHEHSSTARVVTISIGVASLIPEQGMHSSHLVKLVDMALYSAKHAGRNMIRAA